MEDTFNLKRFLDAQENSYAIALSEIQAGRKTSHWIWYIFPQLKDLGRSSTAVYYGIDGMQEAKAYISHPILRSRLIEISNAILTHKDKTAKEILDGIDAKKLRSCMTLFKMAAPDVTVFDDVLSQFYEGIPDSISDDILKGGGSMNWWLNFTNISGSDLFGEIDTIIFAALGLFLIYRLILKPIMTFLGFGGEDDK